MSRSGIWMVLICMGILGLIYISNSGSQTSVPTNNDNQISNINNGSIETQPVTSPTTYNKTNTQAKIVNSTPNPYTSRPSDMSSAIATVVFSNLGSDKTKYIKQYANGADDLTLATYNFALMLDKNPNIAASVLVYILNKNSQGSRGTTLDDLEYKIDDLNDKIDDLQSTLGQ